MLDRFGIKLRDRVILLKKYGRGKHEPPGIEVGSIGEIIDIYYNIDGSLRQAWVSFMRGSVKVNQIVTEIHFNGRIMELVPCKYESTELVLGHPCDDCKLRFQCWTKDKELRL